MKKWLRVCLAAFIFALILCVGSALADTLFCTVCDDWTSAIFVKNTYHDSDGHTVIQKCANCGEQYSGGTEPHYGGAATCASKKICAGCGAEYGAYGDHKYDGTWTYNADHHWQECADCGARRNEEAHADSDRDHLCDVCGKKLSEHDFTAANTDVQYLKAEANCISPALYYKSCTTCGEKGTDTFESGDPDLNNHDLIRHEAKRPACTAFGWDAYVTCARCDYTNYIEIPATGHDYAIKTVKPTCEKDGYSSYICAACGDHFIGDKTAKLLHWYAEWVGNGDGTHSAPCRREGCDHIGTTECAAIEYAQDDAVLMVCPVCGDVSDGTHLALIDSAKAEGARLPMGELVVRIGEIASGETIISAAFEYVGKITTPDDEIQITLPDLSAVRLTPAAAALVGSADGQ